MNEVDVAVGFILAGVSYMKETRMAEAELLDHVKIHYNSIKFDEDGNMIDSVSTGGSINTKGQPKSPLLRIFHKKY